MSHVTLLVSVCNQHTANCNMDVTLCKCVLARCAACATAIDKARQLRRQLRSAKRCHLAHPPHCTVQARFFACIMLFFLHQTSSMLAKLKSRGLSGLAVRQRRLTTNEFEHPLLEDESQALRSPLHADSALVSSTSTHVASSPSCVASPTSNGDIDSPHIQKDLRSESPPIISVSDNVLLYVAPYVTGQ